MIFIKENVPSSKNTRMWTGKRLIASPSVLRWRKATEILWDQNKDEFLSLLVNKKKPYKIGLHFVRKTRHKYDWVNPVQTIQDEMVKKGWLDDDNIEEIVPFPFKINKSFTSYDKDKPGVFIKIY